MSYFRVYTKNEIVRVDKGVWSKNPTLGPCTVEAEVMEDSNAAEVTVRVSPTDPEDGGPMYASKDRVQP